MLRGVFNWSFARPAGSAGGQGLPSIRLSRREPQANSQVAAQATRVVSEATEDAAGHESDCDWDEYGDEIASAVAFSSWQEASANDWDWVASEADLVEDLEDLHGAGARWEDWAAVDEI